MGNYHAGFGREGACFLPEATWAWQRTLTSGSNQESPRPDLRDDLKQPKCGYYSIAAVSLFCTFFVLHHQDHLRAGVQVHLLPDFEGDARDLLLEIVVIATTGWATCVRLSDSGAFLRNGIGLVRTMATEKEKLQVRRLGAIFRSFAKNQGEVTVDYVMNHNPGLFSSKSDCVKYLQDFKLPPFEYWFDVGSSPSIWCLTEKGKAQVEELSKLR